MSYTWKDLKDVLPHIPVNDYGRGRKAGCEIHIYSNKRQVNIIDTFTDLPMEVCLLDEDGVRLFRCHNGATDYNRPFYTASLDEEITRHPYIGFCK